MDLKNLINNLFKETDNIETKEQVLQFFKNLEPEIQEILKNLFNVTNTIVREIMIPRTDMIAVKADIEYENLINVFSKHKFSRIPVYEDKIDNVIGIVYSKDLISYQNRSKEVFSIKSIMREPFFIPETKKILPLLKEFKEKKVHVAIVVDEFGGVSGLVTLIDIVEEIIGHIEDEFQKEEQKIVKLKDKSFLIASKLNIEEFEENFNLRIPEGPYETIGGFVINHFGRIPVKDEKIMIGADAELIVNETYERGIKNLILNILN